MSIQPRTLKLLAILGSAGVISFGVGTTCYMLGQNTASNNISQSEPINTLDTRIPSMLQGIGQSAVGKTVDFSDIVAAYGPAVVNISVTGKTSTGGLTPEADEDDAISEFLKRFGPQLTPKRQAPVVHGLGSGFIFTHDGLILTNAHVIDGADEVIVKLTDRREFKAKVIGLDKNTDVAVIKIKAKDLPTVKIGDPTLSRVGEPVLAIGSPYGFENSATGGIISAKARSLPDDTYVPFIQTDVAVNPGNSGGPLFNHRGEVIGINSQIYSRTGGFQGLSFAIPINVAIHIKDQLVAHGKVIRGRLGITIQPIDGSLAEAFGLSQPRGALVAGLDPRGPAAAAGVQAGDIIVSINGTPINESSELPSYVADVKPGTAIKLGIIRNGKELFINATVTEMKETVLKTVEEKADVSKRLGVAVRLLSIPEMKQLGTPTGLYVDDAGGPAARAGIQTGDVILSVNGTTVTSVKQLFTVVEKSPKQVAILVLRENSRIFVPVKLD